MKPCRWCYGTGVRYWPISDDGRMQARVCERCNGKKEVPTR